MLFPITVIPVRKMHRGMSQELREKGMQMPFSYKNMHMYEYKRIKNEAT